MEAFNLIRPYLASDHDLPAEDIRSEIRAVLLNLENRREGTVRCMNVLSLALSALSQQCKKLDEEISHYKSVISPIRRLPDEMLGEIFLHAMFSTKRLAPNPKEAPLVLTLVCKRWSRVAKATPRLWSKLHIVFPSRPSPSSTISPDNSESVLHQYASGVKRWLELSRDAPLFLSLYLALGHGHADSTFDQVYHPLTQELLLHIIRQSHRWHAVDLISSIRSLWLMNQLITAANVQPLLPKLRRLRFPKTGFNDASHFSQEIYGTFFPFYALSIREFSLNVQHMIAFHKSISVWELLTDLSLHQYSGPLQWLLDILRQCPKVKTLYLSLGRSDVFLVPSSGLITLPKLTTFTLRYRNDEQECICGCLEAPILTHFSFNVTEDKILPNTDNVSRPPSPLRNFLARCATLRSLTFSPLNMREQDITSIFVTVPQIECLAFDYTPRGVRPVPFSDSSPCTSPASQQLFRQHLGMLLQGIGASHCLDTAPPFLPPLPHLQSLSFLFVYLESASAALIMDICKPRLARPSPRPAEDCDSVSEFISYAPLNHIKISASKLDSTVDIQDDLARYAESVGRRVGKDLDLDVSYPYAPAFEYTEFPPSPILRPHDGISYLYRSFDDL
ncbi:hypothetical protein CVT24_005611 [Panaeolus cyanescens]|uniref:Uncharacterized protein n=1 Tax=Panaeolus cyanescens TaxID=181874 RepID=A0A409YXW8_9AGAR|nr:hypothetical protein CVT24_005611 [Panaeolus cyanescens]